MICGVWVQVQSKAHMSSSRDFMPSPDVVAVLGPRWEPCVVSLAHCLRKIGKIQEAAMVRMHYGFFLY